MDDLKKLDIEDLVVLYKEPEVADARGCPIFLLIHGWTGDERSMWIFTNRLPKTALIIAPRAIYSSKIGGYSWTTDPTKRWPSTDDFDQAIAALNRFITKDCFPMADFSRLNLIGFSQGAALAFSYLVSLPNKVHSLAGLSGFLPANLQGNIQPGLLEGKKIFLAHGTKDERVPIELARQDVGTLEKCGAKVTYCEDNVGHKLSASCFRAMDAFFAGQAGC